MLSKTEAKYITSLSQKKFRDAENVFIIEGPKIIEEALAAADAVVKKIYALPEWAAASGLPGHIALSVITEQELQKISQLKTPNRVLALVEKKTDKAGFDVHQLSLALDGIRDPGNLGTIIRIADWFGVEQVICSMDCADVYNPKVVQATMGSIFRVEVTYADLPRWLAGNDQSVIYGAALDGYPLKSFKPVKEGVIVIGNESKGIRENIMPLIRQKITIERLGGAESLNAAVATGILLSHLK